MKGFRVVSGIAFGCLSISIAGCGTIYSDVINEFDKGVTTSKQVIVERAAALDEVKRRKSIEIEFYDVESQPINEDKLKNFVSLVCASSDYLIKQREALAGIDAYNALLKKTNEKPKEEIGALFGSIVDNWNRPESLKPRDASPRTTSRCSEEVRTLVTMKYEDVPEIAPVAAFAAFESFSAMVNAAKKITVVTLGMADDYVRGKKLKGIIIENKDVMKKAFDALNVVDEKLTNWCARNNHKAPCVKNNAVTVLEGVEISQKWASLRKPWHLYLAMHSTQEAHTKLFQNAGRDKSPYWYLMDKQQEELRLALNDYRTLSATAGIGDLGKVCEMQMSAWLIWLTVA